LIDDQLNDRDRAVLRAFALKVQSNMTVKTFNKLPFAFPEALIPSFSAASSRAAFLSGIEAVHYDCCIDSCCCFVGPHESETECPYCQTPHLSAEGHARKTFSYIPLIPRLVALFKNPDYTTKMQYRAYEHVHTPGKTSNVFDGDEYRSRLQVPVVVDGRDIRKSTGTWK
jgi:hypothetical protein